MMQEWVFTIRQESSPVHCFPRESLTFHPFRRGYANVEDSNAENSRHSEASVLSQPFHPANQRQHQGQCGGNSKIPLQS